MRPLPAAFRRKKVGEAEYLCGARAPCNGPEGGGPALSRQLCGMDTAEFSTRYVLVDCNNFYVSCERTVRPALEGRPTVVLSGPNGCVISRSNEAKALGVPMGAPYFQCRPWFEAAGGVALPANFALYDQISRNVMAVLRDSAPQIEVYSVDEAFLRMERIFFWDEFLRDIYLRVKAQTSIPVSLGVAPTKTLAKVAAKIAKKQADRPYCVLEASAEIEAALKATAAGDVWGMGRKSAQKLAEIGVNTAWELRTLSAIWVKKHLHLPGLRIQNELRGLPTLAFTPAPAARKTVSCSRTLEKETDDARRLREAVAGFVRVCAEKLRADGFAAQTLGLYLRTNRFRTDKPRHRPSAETRLSAPAADNESLLAAAWSLLDTLRRPGCEYKKLGVWMRDFVPASQRQLSLFAPPDDARRRRLHEAIDRLNDRMGKRVVRSAAEGARQLTAFNPFRRNAP